jgi:pyridoxamine 5'-phosphate oxidase
MDVDDLAADPLVQVQRWLDDAAAAGIVEPNAMSLATADVAVRTVLLKQIDSGFVFFTNYESAKGRALAADPRAALSLTWAAMGRQIRARGMAAKVAPAESDAYFASRPRGSQLAAWVSPQSQVIKSGDDLDRMFDQVDSRFPGPVPRPPHWGGYRLVPDAVEFWSRRDNRLHDRLRFSRLGRGWRVDRLAP